MMHDLASVLMQHKLDEKMIDVPLSLAHGKKELPLGRYLRRKLRTFIGKEANAPAETQMDAAKELQILREIAWVSQKPLSKVVVDQSKGRRIQIEAKHRRKKREAV